jgi:hypothetical protein
MNQSNDTKFDIYILYILDQDSIFKIKFSIKNPILCNTVNALKYGHGRIFFNYHFWTKIV